MNLSPTPPTPPPPPPPLQWHREWSISQNVSHLARAIPLHLAASPQLATSILLGQGLSFLLAVMGVCSESLVRQGVHLPTLQSMVTYLLLAAFYGSRLLAQHRQRSGTTLREPPWKYALLSMLDFEATFLIVKAYQFTSLTSVTLLDCFTVPAVILLSRVFLKAKYRRGHYAGAIVSVFGLALLVLSDHHEGGGGASKPLMGDLLVLVAASMYAVSNVAQEKMLADVSVVEFLGLLGAFGAVFSAVQFVALEWSAFVAVAWSSTTLMPLLVFASASFVFYSLVPSVLVKGSATVLNLSLLSSDLWAAVARVLFFEGFSQTSAIMFSCSFIFVSIGLIVFTLAGVVVSTTHPDRQGGDESKSFEMEDKKKEWSPLLDRGGSPSLPEPLEEGRVERRDGLD